MNILRRFRPAWLLALVPCVVLSAMVLHSGRNACGGMWPSPIDDAYIYAQYARGFAQGHLFEWSPGEGYTRGATSPLYPLLLTPGWLAGFREDKIMLFAAILNVTGFWIAAAMLGHLLATRTRPGAGIAAVIALVASGPVLWNVASGMEAGLTLGACGIVALAFMRAWERTEERGMITTLAIAQAVLILLRPEAIVACAVLSACLLAARARQLGPRGVLTLLAAPLPLLAYFAMNFAATGSALTASMLTKSIWGDPTLPDKFARFTELIASWPQRLQDTFHGTPLEWYAPLTHTLIVATLVSLAMAKRRALPWLAMLAAHAATILFLCGQRNPMGLHGRYIVPYAPLLLAPIFFAIAHLDERLATALTKVTDAKRREHGQYMLTNLCVGLAIIAIVAPQRIRTIETLAEYRLESRALLDHQIRIGRIIAETNRGAAKPMARVFTHDAGAIMYYSGARGFDPHGLCMEMPGYPIHKAQYEGVLFPFEGLERTVADADLPDVSAVFREGWGVWPNVAEVILAPHFTDPNAVALRAQNFVLYRFPKEAVRSAHTLLASESDGWEMHDRLDVADLVSEREHAFTQAWPDVRPFRGEAVIADRERVPPLADVARVLYAETRFTLSLPKGRSRVLIRAEGIRPGGFECIVGSQNAHISSERGASRLERIAEFDLPEAQNIDVRMTPKAGAALALGHLYVLRQPASESTLATPTETPR